MYCVDDLDYILMESITSGFKDNLICESLWQITILS